MKNFKRSNAQIGQFPFAGGKRRPSSDISRETTSAASEMRHQLWICQSQIEAASVRCWLCPTLRGDFNFLSKGRGHEYFNFRGFLKPRSSHSLVSSLSLPSVPPALSQKPRRQTARLKLLPISNGPAAAAASVVCCSDL